MTDTNDDREASDATGAAEPPAKNDIGNRTMQLDAYVGELEEAGEVAGDAVLAEIVREHAEGGTAAAPIVASLPPPLPPKKASKAMIGVGVGVVVVAIVAGVYVGSLFLGAPQPAPEAQPEPVHVPIQLDTIVVGGSGGGADEAPAEGE